MESELKNIVTKFIKIQILLNILAVILLNLTSLNKNIVMILYATINYTFFGLAYIKISNNIKNALINLNETILSFINNKPEQRFSVSEDTLLSKFQFQLFRLYDILKYHQQTEKKLHTQMSRVIADISHQINTPLTNLKLYSEFLNNENLHYEKQIKFIKNIQTQTEKIEWLVKNIIKMSRLESGIIKLNFTYNSLSQTVINAVDEISLKAEAKSIDIVFESSQDIFLYFDKKWTEEAVFNILDNAVKYSSNNSKITIKLSKYELFSRIDIVDKGMGIKREDINKIFQRFYRGYNSSNEDGFGLGLYLSREIVKKHGGYIKVKSELGKGSMFSIFIYNKLVIDNNV